MELLEVFMKANKSRRLIKPERFDKETMFTSAEDQSPEQPKKEEVKPEPADKKKEAVKSKS